MQFSDYDFSKFMRGRGERVRDKTEIRDAAFNMALVINSMACEFHADKQNDPALANGLSDAWSALWKVYKKLNERMVPVIVQGDEA